MRILSHRLFCEGTNNTHLQAFFAEVIDVKVEGKKYRSASGNIRAAKLSGTFAVASITMFLYQFFCRAETFIGGSHGTDSW
jgi:hypothetical protein